LGAKEKKGEVNKEKIGPLTDLQNLPYHAKQKKKKKRTNPYRPGGGGEKKRQRRNDTVHRSDQEKEANM